MRRELCGLMALLLAWGFFVPARGGDPPSKPETPQEPKPAAEAAQFEPWVGTWRVSIHLAPTATLPAGGTAEGTYTVRKALAGHAYIGDLAARGPVGEFEGHGVFAFDASEKRWKSWWFDSWRPGEAGCGSGEFHDKTLVLESEARDGDILYATRLTETFVGADRVEGKVEADAGKGWEPRLTTVYTRIPK